MEILEQLRKHPRVYTNKLITQILTSGILGFAVGYFIARLLAKQAMYGSSYESSAPSIWLILLLSPCLTLGILVIRTLWLPRRVTFHEEGITAKYLVGNAKDFTYDEIDQIETRSTLQSDRKYVFTPKSNADFQLVLESYEVRGFEQLVRELGIQLKG